MMDITNLHKPTNFIEEIMHDDLREGRVQQINTRLPPEPNGYLHIGHAKNVYVNCFSPLRYGAKVNLRFDDTNPVKEDISFVNAIQEDYRWLGADWAELHFASEYFDRNYECAELLIQKGLAYVDDLTPEQMREYRGTLTEPGRNSPWRDRSIEENLDLFRRMKDGEFPDGSKVLRAKIDMASPNMNMRDPAIYRIKHAHHQLTGDKWCIYPMYDYSHPLDDAIEGITHSMCSLEFEDHRPLYDWVVRECGYAQSPPRQIEYARMNITGTIMSKRYLRKLVEEGFVSGWDDPRMPTLRGMRRRGYSPASILEFIKRTGVAKAATLIDFRMLEACVREELGGTAPRAMAVLHPLKLRIVNIPEGETRTFTLPRHPEHPEWGVREIPFSRDILIDAEDFSENPPPKYFRLKPDGEVRLMGAFIVKCVGVERGADGSALRILCEADLDSYTGGPTASRKVKGTIHWVDENEALPIKVRLYASLLLDNEGGGEQDDYMSRVNKHSLTELDAFAEPSLRDAAVMDRFQFVRDAYYIKDMDSTDALPVFNRIVSLKDAWERMNKQG